MNTPASAFVCVPDPANPGWNTWGLTDKGRFNDQVIGKLIVRREESATGRPVARVRMMPEPRHSNMLNSIHGGLIMGFSDIVLFAAFHLLTGGDADGSVTLDMHHQFLAPGKIDEPLDGVAEILRETGRLVFIRGLIEQGDHQVAAFSATLRKPTVR